MNHRSSTMRNFLSMAVNLQLFKQVRAAVCTRARRRRRSPVRVCVRVCARRLECVRASLHLRRFIALCGRQSAGCKLSQNITSNVTNSVFEVRLVCGPNPEVGVSRPPDSLLPGAFFPLLSSLYLLGFIFNFNHRVFLLSKLLCRQVSRHFFFLPCFAFSSFNPSLLCKAEALLTL